MFKNRYRIVRDNYLGYEVQVKSWWLPFWRQGITNTHDSVEKAERYAKVISKQVIKYVD